MYSSNQIIKQASFVILIVIDTIGIKNKYLNHNINIENVMKIDSDHWFVVYPNRNDLGSTESLNLVNINGKSNDKIIFSAISIDCGFSDAIILSKVKNYRFKNRMHNPFKPICLSKKRILNSQNDGEEIQVSNSNHNIIWFEALISGLGKSKIKINLSLYSLNSDGNQQSLYGHFWFPLTMCVYEKSKF